eukprot:15375521-Alexandrium_andersonii.AAC.1
MVGLEEWCRERLVPRACLCAWSAFADALVVEIEAAVGEDLREWGVAELEQLVAACVSRGGAGCAYGSPGALAPSVFACGASRG